MKFTFEEGIKIQSEQLAKWKKVLAIEAHSRLERYCEKRNAEGGLTGLSVFRGTDLDMFVQNNLMLENNYYKE
jgi:hypothetical protein